MIILIFLIGFYIGCAFITFIEEYNEAHVYKDIPIWLLIIICLLWPYKYYHKSKINE